MNKRLVLAFVLAIVFFTAYTKLFVEPSVKRQQAAAQAAAEAEAAAAAVPAPAAEAPAPPVEAAAPFEVQPAPIAPAPAPAAAQVAPAQDIYGVPDRFRPENVDQADVAVSNNVLDVVFTPSGGAIKSLSLRSFEALDRSGELTLLRDFAEGEFPAAITRLADRDVAQWPFVLESVTRQEDGSDIVVFVSEMPSGYRLTRTYALRPGRYGLDLDVRIDNLLDRPQPLVYEIRGPAGIPAEDYSGHDVVGILADVPAEQGVEGKVNIRKRPAQALRDKGGFASDPGMRANFAGAFNRYFAAVMRPDSSVPLTGASVHAIGSNNAGASFTVGVASLAPAGAEGASVTHSYILYGGPKDRAALTGFDTNATRTGFVALLDYGMLEPLVKVVLVIMGGFHAVIPNWGVAIILLTLLIRLLMHPLTKKSQVAMAKMQRLQPHIKKLQEKHKGDKQKLGAEQMKLMKEHGANPLGGCLPMLIQLPIFFALYRALSVSLDLRHAPFMLWIDNLSQPDRLFQMPMSLPLIGDWFNLLPILMATAMVFQMKMSPQAPTPEAAQQQKIMMMFMPVFMGVILYNFAAGLNLYILTSTVAGIIEQWLIRRHLAKQEAA